MHSICRWLYFIFPLFLVLPYSEQSAYASARESRDQKQHRGIHLSEGKRLKLRPVILEHLTTHAKYALRPNANSGLFSKRQLDAVKHLFKCHHTGKEKPIHAELVSLLYQIGQYYHFAKIYIIAGYRDPNIARKKGNPRSPHQKGVASDIRVNGVSPEQLRDYLLSLNRKIGVGYYPHSGFVHVDVDRTHHAYWIDASLPGQRAFYIDSTLRGKQLKKRLQLAKRFLVKTQRRRHRVAFHAGPARLNPYPVSFVANAEHLTAQTRRN